MRSCLVFYLEIQFRDGPHYHVKSKRLTKVDFVSRDIHQILEEEMQNRTRIIPPSQHSRTAGTEADPFGFSDSDLELTLMDSGAFAQKHNEKMSPHQTLPCHSTFQGQVEKTLPPPTATRYFTV
jgi:hypothetical protein